MKIDNEIVENIAELTQLEIAQEELSVIGDKMSEVLALVEEMQAVDTSGIEPVSNPLDVTQTLRPDIVTSEDNREIYQSFAPETRNGLYLVPKVID
ncbi:MAG: Asp-tRNA(Asn)/Glu-tRNA(Gln) amidotransferase subunit GatC [Gammaproteobacteria bacterium TMED1]|nr:MAG: Asp-tRNA(Asn)/Glu-tRNA(Gln) amidotransferase subunit GatC [Gammaproteobacteria bacterium TMED1]